jgi:hypothetical protein
VIIVEGMDGTGKTNLVARLKKDLGIPQAKRASTSVGGPVPNVYDWAKVDVATWEERPCQIYDRHPFVSELIYGPTCREHVDSQFFSLAGIRMRNWFWSASLVIFCTVPWEELETNLRRNPEQMPGVAYNAKMLWLNYQVFMSGAQLNAASHIKTWNYTRPDYDSVLAACERHVQDWKTND